MKTLPDVRLFDSVLEDSGWTWQDGVCDLIPSISTLADVSRKWGKPSSISEQANGFTYDYLNGAVRITVFTDQSVVEKIVINRRGETTNICPPDIVAATRLYGIFQATRVDRLDGVVFERPGMRLICDAGAEPANVLRMEVFRPCPE